MQEELAVADTKLGCSIRDKLGMRCVYSSAIQELMRCIRSQLEGLLGSVTEKEISAMRLGLAHSLSRYKLKYSPDQVDTMVTHAVCLLDDLDKEINNYIMRCREWYGWHFPELTKLIPDNKQYVKTVQLVGMRDNFATSDLSDILPEIVESQVKLSAELSMGTEITDEDALFMQDLCTEIIGLVEYRESLNTYVHTRMMMMAPNLSILVGELVAARLMSHAGSLINLAKHPASTVQILGAEKALFRALKSKRDTPKYGLIYHSQLVTQSSKKNKGKMSRMLAAKASLATRYDALVEVKEQRDINLGLEHKSKLQRRLQELEQGNMRRISGTAKAKAKFEKYYNKNEYLQYSTAVDSTLPRAGQSNEENDTSRKVEQEKKKRKRPKSEDKNIPAADDSTLPEAASSNDGVDASQKEEPEKKKKKKSKKGDKDTSVAVNSTLPEAVSSNDGVDASQREEPKKKKKKKSKKEDKDTSVAVDSILSETVPSNGGIDVSQKEKKKKHKSKSEHISVANDSTSPKAGPSHEGIDTAQNEEQEKKRKRAKSIDKDTLNNLEG